MHELKQMCRMHMHKHPVLPPQVDKVRIEIEKGCGGPSASKELAEPFNSRLQLYKCACIQHMRTKELLLDNLSSNAPSELWTRVCSIIAFYNLVMFNMTSRTYQDGTICQRLIIVVERS